MWGVVDPGQKISHFPAISQNNFDLSRQISEDFDFCQAISSKKLNFPGKNFGMTPFPFIQTKLVIYSYFWPNYSISLQRSLLSNILPVHDQIIIIFHDPPRPHDSRATHDPQPQIWGFVTPPTPRIDAYGSNNFTSCVACSRQPLSATTLSAL